MIKEISTPSCGWIIIERNPIATNEQWLIALKERFGNVIDRFDFSSRKIFKIRRDYVEKQNEKTSNEKSEP